MDNQPKLGRKVPMRILYPKERKILIRQKRLQRSEKYMIPKTKFEQLRVPETFKSQIHRI